MASTVASIQGGDEARCGGKSRGSLHQIVTCARRPGTRKYRPMAPLSTTPRERSALDDTRGLTVEKCLEIAPLAEATVVGGRAALSTREVHWMTVIEGPVDDFVSPGDFVLTTGLGYGAGRLRELAGDVAD